MTQQSSSNAHATASSWLIVVWIFAGLNAVGAFVLFGNAFPTTAEFSSKETFNGLAGIGGALSVVLFYLPWIGILTVLKAMTANQTAG